MRPGQRSSWQWSGPAAALSAPRPAAPQMLALCGGLERTALQLRQLLATAGLQLVGVHSTEGPLAIVEARAA